MIWRLTARLFLVGALLTLAGFSPLWPPPVTGGYVGPADLYAYTSFYSCSIAANKIVAKDGTTKACHIYAVTTAAASNAIMQECDVFLKPTGYVDLDTKLSCNSNTQTINAWGAPRTLVTATCNASSSGTTLTVNSCSIGAPGVLMELDTTTNFIVAQINATQWQLNTATTFGAGTHTLHPPSIRVATFFDQLGSVSCGGSCDALRTGTVLGGSVQFGWGADGVCTLPLSITACVHNDGRSGTGYFSAGTFTAPSTLGIGAVGMSVSGTNTYIKAAGFVSATETSNSISDNVAGAAWYGSINGSAACISTPATNSVIHSDVGVLKGANSTMTLDGTTSAPTTCTPSAQSGSLRLFGRSSENTQDIYWAAFGGTDMSTATQCLLTNINNKLFGTAKGSC